MFAQAEKHLFIASRNLFPLLFSFKSKHPELDIKFMTKEDVVHRLGIVFTKDPIPFLIHHGHPYGNAKKIVRLLSYVEPSENEKIKVVFDQLSKEGYIGKDLYGKIEITRRKVHLIELKEDQELRQFLCKNGISFDDIPLKSLGFEENDLGANHVEAILFPDKLTQFFYIYADIRKRLLEDPSIKNRIQILIKDDYDLFYLRLVSSLFKIPTYCPSGRSFFSSEVVACKIKKIHLSRQIEFSEEELLNDELKSLSGIIDYYGLNDERLDFDFRYACLIEIVSSMTSKDEAENRGIIATKDFNFDSKAIVYVTNFQYGDFYKSFDDKDILPDDELNRLGVNPSYVKTSLDRNLKLLYLKHVNIVLLSRVSAHLSDKIYDSQFIAELKWGKANCPGQKKVSKNCDGVYTKEAAAFFKANELDRAFVFDSSPGFRDYDHSFSGIKESPRKKRKIWSITNIEKYIDCPYAYYLRDVIKDPFEDAHNISLGVYLHKACESLYADMRDENGNIKPMPDEVFEAAKADYKKDYEEKGGVYGPKQEFFLRLVRHYFDLIAYCIRDIYSSVNFPSAGKYEFAEEEINFTLGRGYDFSGRIDKVFLSESKSDLKKYYTIVDYKSGKEDFRCYEIFLGKSIQLPLYYFAIEEAKKTDTAPFADFGSFGGFLITHVFKNSAKDIVSKDGKVSLNPIQSFIKGSGVSDNNNGGDYQESIGYEGKGKNPLYSDSSFLVNEDVISKRTKRKGGPYYKSFDALIKDAIEAAKSTIGKIRDAKFDIAPTYSDLSARKGDRTSCTFCSYRDICYRDLDKDLVCYADDIHRHFNPYEPEGEGGEDDEE